MEKTFQFPPQNQQDLVGEEARLVRGDNQVNMVFVEGLQRISDGSD